MTIESKPGGCTKTKVRIEASLKHVAMKLSITTYYSSVIDVINTLKIDFYWVSYSFRRPAYAIRFSFFFHLLKCSLHLANLSCQRANLSCQGAIRIFGSLIKPSNGYLKRPPANISWWSATPISTPCHIYIIQKNIYSV